MNSPRPGTVRYTAWRPDGQAALGERQEVRALVALYLGLLLSKASETNKIASWAIWIEILDLGSWHKTDQAFLSVPQARDASCVPRPPALEGDPGDLR